MFKVVHCFDHVSEEDTTFATPHKVSEFADFDEDFDAIRPRFSKTLIFRMLDCFSPIDDWMASAKLYFKTERLVKKGLYILVKWRDIWNTQTRTKS